MFMKWLKLLVISEYFSLRMVSMNSIDGLKYSSWSSFILSRNSPFRCWLRRTWRKTSSVLFRSSYVTTTTLLLLLLCIDGDVLACVDEALSKYQISINANQSFSFIWFFTFSRCICCRFCIRRAIICKSWWSDNLLACEDLPVLWFILVQHPDHNVVLLCFAFLVNFYQEKFGFIRGVLCKL